MSTATAISTTEFGRGFAPDQDHALTATHPEDPAVAETFAVWLHDAANDVGVELRIHAQHGVAEGRAVVFLPGGRILHSQPEHAPLTDGHAPATEHVHYTCLESFRHWRYQLDALGMRETTDDAHERGAVTDGREVAVSLDFDATTVGPIWVQGALLPEAAEAMKGPAGLWIAGRLTNGMSPTAYRYDQPLGATGTITVDGETIAFEGYGLRGHVRGVRIMDGFKAHTWVGAVFPGSGTAVGLQCHMLHGTPGGYEFSEAYVWRDGVLYPNRVIYAPPVSRDDPHAEFVVELACDELGLTRLHGHDTRVAWTSMGSLGLGGMGSIGVATDRNEMTVIDQGRGLMPNAGRVMSQALTVYELDGEPGAGMCERSG
jgi:hypothetical protein